MNKALLEFNNDKYKVKLLVKNKSYLVFINNKKTYWSDDFEEVKEFYFNLTKQLITNTSLI
mgnify:FL=1